MEETPQVEVEQVEEEQEKYDGGEIPRLEPRVEPDVPEPQVQPSE